MRIALIAILTAAATPAAAETLTLDEAVKTAVAHHPDVRGAEASELGAEAAADQARAPLLPSLTASANYSVSGNSANDTLADPGHLLRGALDADILVWDFGQTSGRWRSAKASAESARFDTRRARADVVLTVRVSFLQARAAKELVRVAQEALDNEARHLQQIEAFVEIGTRPQIDLYQSRTSVANAKVTLIKAQNDYEAAKATLNQAMGVERTTAYDVADESMPVIPGEDRTSADLLEESVKARPEFASIEADRRSQELIVSAARAEYFPSLRASAGLDAILLNENGGAGTFGTGSGRSWGWNAGLSLVWPIFEGFATRAKVRNAQAGVLVVDSKIASLRQQVLLELEQDLLAVRSSTAELQAAGEADTNAERRLELAEGRYKEGVGTAIELGDAQVERTRASAQLVQAQYGLAIARAQLLHALGRP